MKSNNINNDYMSLRDIWEMIRENIWLFVVSIAIAISAALCYLAITPPQYQRTASILIKDDQHGVSIEDAAFESMGLVQSNNDINNEIHILSTAQLMEEVVSRLSLDKSYRHKRNNIRWVDLYHNAPFRVALDNNLATHAVELELIACEDESFEIKGVRIDDEKISCNGKCQFDKPLPTPYGEFTLLREQNGIEPITDGIYSFSKQSVKSSARALSHELAVALRDQKAQIIDLSITMGSREMAEDVINMLISVYNENWIKDKNLVSLSTTNFINERLSIIAKELGDVDENISSYKSKNLLPDVGVVAGMNLQSSNEILKQQIELNNQLSMAKYIMQYIEAKRTNDQLLPVNSGVGSSAIDEQIARYNEVLLQKNTLLANSSVSNPIVAQLIAQLDSMKSVLVISINDLINTLKIQIESARKEEIATQQRISNNPSQELYLLSTGREQMVKEQLYLFLLQKREENELNQAFTAYNTKVLSLASGDDTPVSPQIFIIILIALSVGIMAPIAFLILKHTMNITVTTKEDLKGLSIPYLGSIPLVGSNKGKILRLFNKNGQKGVNNEIVVNNSRDVVNESFRLIRTNLDFILSQRQRCKVINITSYNPGSGKSFVILNLAISMAIKEKRVLIMDADFRRGTLSQSVNSPTIGAVNYLNGSQKNIESLIIKGRHNPYLDILPMGMMPPNPTELLLNENFSLMVEQLKPNYDYIFFDCPPIEVVPDAMIVERICDSTIFIARAGLMDKRLLSDLEELYISKKLKHLSLILNGVDPRNMNRYGYGGYCYGAK